MAVGEFPIAGGETANSPEKAAFARRNGGYTGLARLLNVGLDQPAIDDAGHRRNKCLTVEIPAQPDRDFASLLMSSVAVGAAVAPAASPQLHTGLHNA
jgi:hypothetical protein